MTRPLVSVVIPVYNVAPYLSKCVASVCDQTLKDIEIILVNDGSTDNSGEICDELALTDSRIRVVHKKNGGLSDARNVGVQNATADLVGFVDSDDTVEPTMYEVLYTVLNEFSADTSFCGILDLYADHSRRAYRLSDAKFVKTSEETIEMVLEGHNASVSAVNKLYRRDLLLKHPFLKGKTSEDAHFIIQYLLDCEKIAFDMRPQYHYFHREGSITTSGYKSSDLSIIEAYENNLRLIEDNYPSLVPLARFRLFWSYFYVLDKMLRTEQFLAFEDKRKIISFLRNHYLEIVTNKSVGRNRKIALTTLLVHEKGYRFLLNRYMDKTKKLN